MLFEKELTNDDYNIKFSQETTDSGSLVSQTLYIEPLRKDRESFSYNFRHSDNLPKELTLYHVTFKDKFESILKEGLKPTVGYGYKNHWLSFFIDEDIENALYPGVFLKAEEPINGFRSSDEYPCFAINIDDLDPNYIFVDDSIDNSFIYTKTIKPEKFKLITFNVNES